MGRPEQHLPLIILSIITFSVLLADAQRWSYGKQTSNSKESRNYSSRSAPEIPPKAQQSKSSKSRGLGAWGIIAITLTVILSFCGIYYFVTFYPIVCKKERMYDVMEMTTV